MAIDVFLSIPGIPGESQDATFPATIVTPSYQFALENSARLVAGGGSGKASFQPLTIQKTVDKASPRLFQALTLGKIIAAMTLLVRRSGGNASAATPFLVYQLNTVRVTSLQDAGSAGGESPYEEVTFVFGAYHLGYRAVNPDGTRSSSVETSAWSILTNSVPKGPAPH